MPARKRTVDVLTCENCAVTFPYKHSGGKANRFCSRDCAYRRTHEQRFWAKVDKFGPIPEACQELGCCWCWLGSLFTDSGYGQFWLDGTNRRAHIVSYEWTVGPTDGQQVQHRCNVRVCVNPAHLTLGTPAENTAYAVKHGRMASGERHWLRKGPDTRQHAKGERNGTAKLTATDVREMRRLDVEGMPAEEISARFPQVSIWTIYQIISYRSWQHIE